MFEQNVFEIAVQAGSMVGVDKEERASTPCSRISRIIGYGGQLRRQWRLWDTHPYSFEENVS